MVDSETSVPISEPSLNWICLRVNSGLYETIDSIFDNTSSYKTVIERQRLGSLPIHFNF